MNQRSRITGQPAPTTPPVPSTLATDSDPDMDEALRRVRTSRLAVTA